MMIYRTLCIVTVTVLYSHTCIVTIIVFIIIVLVVLNYCIFVLTIKLLYHNYGLIIRLHRMYGESNFKHVLI